MYRENLEWVDLRKTLKELLRCAYSERQTHSAADSSHMKGKIVVLNYQLRKIFSSAKISSTADVEKVISMSEFCTDCIAKLLSPLSPTQYVLVSDIVCMSLDAIFRQYCRILIGTGLSLSTEPNLLLLIEDKVKACDSSNVSRALHSLQDALEALFLIDWEPDVAAKLLVQLVPMLSHVPGVLMDFKVKAFIKCSLQSQQYFDDCSTQLNSIILYSIYFRSSLKLSCYP